MKRTDRVLILYYRLMIGEHVKKQLFMEEFSIGKRTFDRYIDTIFYLYRKEESFRRKFENSKGFCCEHYGMLYEAAPRYLSGRDLEAFTKLIDRLFLENMKRVCDDIEWYTDKFDYRNVDAPWKNSKDAVIRTILKLDSAEVKL